MRSDSDIKRDVEEELKWEPNVDATDIAVAVKNGVVTLTGFVRSYAHKLAAERAAKSVAVSSAWQMTSKCVCRGPTRGQILK
jgi:osmotically-inducible protein OsmY